MSLAIKAIQLFGSVKIYNSDGGIVGGAMGATRLDGSIRLETGFVTDYVAPGCLVTASSKKWKLAMEVAAVRSMGPPGDVAERIYLEADSVAVLYEEEEDLF